MADGLKNAPIGVHNLKEFIYLSISEYFVKLEEFVEMIFYL